MQRRATAEAFKILGWVDLETEREAQKCILVPFNFLRKPRNTMMALFYCIDLEKLYFMDM